MNSHLILSIASGLLVSAVTFNSDAQYVAARVLPASACRHEPPISIPASKLINFDSPVRIPNAYLVAFKCDKALAVYKANAGSRRSQVLRGMLPTSQANCVEAAMTATADG
jgi:hypothetical protein